MNTSYIPPAYRPRLFPRIVYWVLVAAGSVVVVYGLVLLCWVADALYHGPQP